MAVADTAPGAIRASMMGFALFAADGWTGSGLYFVWPITLFVTLGKSFAAFGGAMALAALAGAAAGLLLGRHIDAGHGRRAVWVAFAVLAITILARAGATTPAMALTANALGALVPCLYTPTLMTAVYNLAQGSPARCASTWSPKAPMTWAAAWDACPPPPCWPWGEPARRPAAGPGRRDDQPHPAAPLLHRPPEIAVAA
uniref:Uncharacterized protein n=1 Tax=Phenylobacterium glaciei TaxID=2803784 RepID=A0A974P4R3_9CAUL|nr:hypothetical protein JKL49_01545 [Phenylobacterium glaciei]